MEIDEFPIRKRVKSIHENPLSSLNSPTLPEEEIKEMRPGTISHRRRPSKLSQFRDKMNISLDKEPLKTHLSALNCGSGVVKLEAAS